MSDIGRISGQAGELILVVEDSPTQAIQLRYLLEKNRYQVAVATSGGAALAMIPKLQPALIISDIIMPQMDGYELCRRIKEIEGPREIPVILLTSLSDPQGVIRGLACGADNFITKPYKEGLLLSRITDMLENRHLEQEPSALPGLEISFASQKYLITSDRRQILDLLLSTYEAAIHKNDELIMAQDELNLVNERLENLVAERTADLVATIENLKVETIERMRALEALREKEQMLIQQSRLAAMGEMIGNIAHQWRQPLNTLGLIVQQAPLYFNLGKLDKDFVDSSAKKSMDIIRHMSQTIDDFSNFFKPDKEKVIFKLNEVLAKTLLLIEGSIGSQGISIEIDAREELDLYGYPNEFSQVLINILANARDALMERDVEGPKVTITLGREGKRVVVCIADNAGGITLEIMDKIFDPYFTTKGPDKGTGVGLFMSKTIIEKNMGGRLSVRNIANGAEFRIEV
ncbi:MAG: response regulator [Desulfuromonadales bacterium]|nr:response regulator [Desulfuromonadales bacterium]